MSNSERISRKAAEVAASDEEKAAKKKAAPAKRPSKAKQPKAPERLKIVWCVGDPNAASAKRFPYSERAAADAEAERQGKGQFVRTLRVPME